MRIDNSKTFDNPSRYRTYKRSQKEPAKATDSGKENMQFIYHNENILPIFSKANQAIVDNPDGSREIYLTAIIDGTKPLFTRIKLYDPDATGWE